MKNIDVQKLNQVIEKFVQDRDWDQFHSIKNLSMGLNVESSELMEIFQWMKEEDSNLIKNDPKTMLRIEEELADIFYFLLLMSKKMNVDLEEALLKKIVKNAEKYPVELAKGNSRKYSDL